MNLGILSWLITVFVFGAIGWSIARKRSRPAGPLTFVVLLLVAVVGYYIGVGARLVDVDGFKIFFNWAIVSCCVGGCVRLLIRNRELRRIGDT